MSYNSNQHYGSPAGAPPNMAANFNAMLQRSVHEQQPQDGVAEAPGSAPQANALFPGPYGAPPSGPTPPSVLGGARGLTPQPVLPVDLPPQAFLTSAMLLDMVDKKVDVLLRDEKEFIGILRSYDQFANLVLTECSERISARNPKSESDPTIPKWLACDVKLPGVMTVRGENVTICATVDLDKEDNPTGLKFVPEEEVRALAASQKTAKKTVDDRKAKALKKAGIEPSFGMQA